MHRPEYRRLRRLNDLWAHLAIISYEELVRKTLEQPWPSPPERLPTTRSAFSCLKPKAPSTDPLFHRLWLGVLTSDCRYHIYGPGFLVQVLGQILCEHSHSQVISLPVLQMQEVASDLDQKAEYFFLPHWAPSRNTHPLFYFERNIT